jgi:hypothetical protein
VPRPGYLDPERSGEGNLWPTTMVTFLSYSARGPRDNSFAALNDIDDDDGRLNSNKKRAKGLDFEGDMESGSIGGSTGDSGVAVNENDNTYKDGEVRMAGFVTQKRGSKQRKKFAGTNASRTMRRLEIANGWSRSTADSATRSKMAKKELDQGSNIKTDGKEVCYRKGRDYAIQEFGRGLGGVEEEKEDDDEATIDYRDKTEDENEEEMLSLHDYWFKKGGGRNKQESGGKTESVGGAQGGRGSGSEDGSDDNSESSRAAVGSKHNRGQEEEKVDNESSETGSVRNQTAKNKYQVELGKNQGADGSNGQVGNASTAKRCASVLSNGNGANENDGSFLKLAQGATPNENKLGKTLMSQANSTTGAQEESKATDNEGGEKVEVTTVKSHVAKQTQAMRVATGTVVARTAATATKARATTVTRVRQQ